MKIVFMGTPEFAACSLRALVEAGHTITGVYTQPDRPKGRSGAPVASAVKEYALSQGFDIYQPERIKVAEQVEILKKIPADIFVVAAFGQFLSEEILNIPRFGCINVHGSLLPGLRGAAPIQRCIMNGDEITGVTIMQMDKGMDSGDILNQQTLEISGEDNETTLYAKLADIGAKLLIETLPLIESGTIEPVKQADELVTFAPMLKKEEGRIDFSKSAKMIDCMVRGMIEWPVAFTSFNGKTLKIYGTVPNAICEEAPTNLAPGTAVVTKKKVFVATGSGLLELTEVQPEGKKRMSAIDFARGVHLATNDKFGL